MGMKKPKISYKTIMANTELSAFMEKPKAKEQEASAHAQPE